MEGAKNMKLLIFGSTGSIGRELVKQALDQGHTVTAFTRDPAKLDIQHPSLKITQGDVMDFAAVVKAVQGQDAVLCVLGSGRKRKGKIRSEGTQQIIRAMEKLGVQRFICQTTLGAGESWENLNFFWKYIMFGVILRDVFADHEKQENYVKHSRLDWTIVRPGAFTNGNHTGKYRYAFPSTDKTTKLKISHADVADFMLKQLVNDSSLHKALGLSY
jgi:putative NADH-flavin reductase